MCVTAAGWPVMHEVIDEAREWYWDNRASLPNPDAFATPVTRRLSPDAPSAAN